MAKGSGGAGGEAARRRAAAARVAAERKASESRDPRPEQSGRGLRLLSDEVLLEYAKRAQRESVKYSKSARACVVERDYWVAELRGRGVSWSELADVLGVTRQALMKRAGSSAGSVDEVGESAR